MTLQHHKIVIVCDVPGCSNYLTKMGLQEGWAAAQLGSALMQHYCPAHSSHIESAVLKKPNIDMCNDLADTLGVAPGTIRPPWEDLLAQVAKLKKGAP